MTDRLRDAVDAGDLPLVQRLLEEKADISGSNSPLHLAVVGNKPAFVEALLAARASPEVGSPFIHASCPLDWPRVPFRNSFVSLLTQQTIRGA
jgi:hypothetical protein